MLLKSFKAKEVYGYLNLNIDFNKDITFLHGVNGTGKTTVLKLMQAVLTPSLKELHTIVYKEIELTYTDNIHGKVKTFKIKVNKEQNLSIKIYISNKNEHELTLALIDEEELEFLLKKDERYFSELLISKRDNPVIELLTSINAPLFLGLDRRSDKSEQYHEFERYHRDYYEHENRIRRKNRLISGSLGISLMESEILVQNKYKMLKRLEDIQKNKLREELLITSFDYTDIDSLAFEKLRNPNYLTKILERKKEIETSLEKLSDDSKTLLDKAEEFFSKLEKLKQKSSKKNDDKDFVDIELITNHVQIARMEKLIKTIDLHKSRVDKYFTPVNKFLNIINKFFSSSDKEILINSVGQIRIKKPNDKIDTIEALSSGERQIIIIFIYLIFDESKSKIFIIDEPELSLHLQWQDIFTKSIQEVSPDTQFILATHSPEIVSGLINKTSSIG